MRSWLPIAVACAASIAAAPAPASPEAAPVARSRPARTPAASPPPVRPLVFLDVTVIDVRRGRRRPGRTVLVAGGRIAAVGDRGAVSIPAGAVRVDGRGKFLIPGLVDLHVHLFNNVSHRPPSTWAFPMFIAAGVTSVREMAALPEQLAQVARWRDDVERGALVAPRVLAAGVPVNGASTDQVRRQVRAAAARGADFIKVFSDVRPTEWRAILDEARRLSIPVDGHVPAAVPLATAAAAGQRTAEHLMQAYEACSSIERPALESRRALSGAAAVQRRDAEERRVLEQFDPAACARAAAAVAATGQAHVPTLVLGHHEATGPGARYTADPRWARLRSDEQARWKRILDQSPPSSAGLAALRWTVSCRIVRHLHRAGVPVLAGTDAPMPLVYPGDSLREELELLVSCGLPPADALRAATSAAADALALSNTGAIAVGHRADLVLLDADPLLDIHNLRLIRAVVLAGRLLRREHLAR
jgi:imidazolonepropionase-like amidohydrolase